MMPDQPQFARSKRPADSPNSRIRVKFPAASSPPPWFSAPRTRWPTATPTRRAGCSDSPYVAVAAAWEKCSLHIAAHADPQWAIEANDRAIETWGQIRKRSPGSTGLSALSRLCLANTRLALRKDDKPAAARYAALTTGKMRAGLREDKVRAPVALDTIEACLLMLELGLPERSGDPSWRDSMAEALQWIDKHTTRLTPDQLSRHHQLTVRLDAIPAK
jgi:hypothetical protein